jgi:ABC-2 type transport system permease protein
MNARRTRAITRKEFRHIVRDPRSLIMALAVPLLLVVLFGYALSLDVDRIPTLIYDGDNTIASRALVQRFIGSSFFEIRGFVRDYVSIEKAIDRNSVLLGVVIPVNYSREITAGHQANVQLLLDGSDSNTASIALGYAESLVRAYSEDLGIRAQSRKGAGPASGPAVDTKLRIWYNPELESKNYVVPGLIAVILMIIAALLTSLTIAREWETSTMEQLLSTPIRPAELVLGKMLAFFAIGLADAAIAIAAAVVIFGVPLRGNTFFLMFTTCVFLCGTLCWGIFLSAAARSQLLAYQLGLLTSFMPSFLLSGFIYSVENMPGVIQAVTRIVPARYFVTILRGIFLKGVGLSVLWGETLLLAGFAILVFSLATQKLRQKLA